MARSLACVKTFSADQAQCPDEPNAIARHLFDPYLLRLLVHRRATRASLVDNGRCGDSPGIGTGPIGFGDMISSSAARKICLRSPLFATGDNVFTYSRLRQVTQSTPASVSAMTDKTAAPAGRVDPSFCHNCLIYI
jgi:hypothetical protein